MLLILARFTALMQDLTREEKLDAAMSLALKVAATPLCIRHRMMADNYHHILGSDMKIFV
jgi:hypothetical protein